MNDMDEIMLRDAKQYHVQRDRRRYANREQRRLEHLGHVKNAILELGPHYPAVQRVYVYGSLVQPGRYGFRSDVDIAVVSDAVAEVSRFWQALEYKLGFSLDLRPYQGAVAWAVDTCGECIYEREVSGSRT